MLFLPVSEGLPWDQKYFRLFISHINQHKNIASDIQSYLAQYNITCFVAHNDISPTAEWENVIKDRLHSCDAVLALLHPGFHQSFWTDQEIGIALGLDKLIISLDYGENPYGFMGRFQAMKTSNQSINVICDQLFELLRYHPMTKRRISEIIVNMFRDSANFDQAKKNIGLIEKLEYWDDSLSQLAKKGVEENFQISNAWDVPERLNKYINNWKNYIQF